MIKRENNMPTDTDTNTINSEALKYFRKRQSLTQEQLADRIKCTKDTISRWERRKSKRLRSQLRESLCEAFHVKWEDLTAPPKQKTGKSGDRAYGRVKLNLMVKQEVRTALRLVALRYNVRRREIVELAPLLFLIVAELSLLERQKRFKEIDEKLWSIQEELGSSHLDTNIAMVYGDAVNLIGCGSDYGKEELIGGGLVSIVDEDESIQKRDIFGLQLHQSDSEENQGPLVNFIRQLASEVSKNALGHVSIDDVFRRDIDYRIAEDTLREHTGLSEDEEQDKKLLDHIRMSNIDLAECLRVKRERDDAGYRQWLLDELTRIKEEGTTVTKSRRWVHDVLAQMTHEERDKFIKELGEREKGGINGK